MQSAYVSGGPRTEDCGGQATSGQGTSPTPILVEKSLEAGRLSLAAESIIHVGDHQAPHDSLGQRSRDRSVDAIREGSGVRNPALGAFGGFLASPQTVRRWTAEEVAKWLVEWHCALVFCDRARESLRQRKTFGLLNCPIGGLDRERSWHSAHSRGNACAAADRARSRRMDCDGDERAPTAKEMKRAFPRGNGEAFEVERYRFWRRMARNARVLLWTMRPRLFR